MSGTLLTRPCAYPCAGSPAQAVTAKAFHGLPPRSTRVFDNSLNQWFSGSNSLFHPGTGAFSIQAWIYPTNWNSTNAHGIFKVTTNTGAVGDFMLGIGGSGAEFLFYLWENTGSDTDGRHDFATAISLNAWHHVVVTVTAAPRTITLYVNNAVVSQTGTANTFSGWSNETAVGTLWTGDGTYDFGGRQCGHGYWEKVLTAGNVATLYNNGRLLLFSELGTGLDDAVAYYDGNEDSDGANLIDQVSANNLADNNTVSAGAGLGPS